MMRYFATFISGTGEIITKRLKQFSLSELTIIDSQDGLVQFNSTVDTHKLTHLRFFTNVFLLLADLGKQPSIETAIHSVPTLERKVNIKGTFRIVVLNEGSPTALSVPLKDHLVACIGRDLGLRFDPTNARHDVVILRRRDGKTLLGLRLDKPTFKKYPKAGALSLEMAHILCLVAGIGAKDIVLDPFAGSGSIPLEAVRDFNVQKAIAVESDRQLAASISTKGLARLEVLVDDATQLSTIPDKSVTRIVTDPPWGKFKYLDEGALDALYQHMLRQMVRVVRKGGVIVMLTAVDLQRYINQFPLEIVKNYPVLIAGQKATIYKLRVNT